MFAFLFSLFLDQCPLRFFIFSLFSILFPLITFSHFWFLFHLFSLFSFSFLFWFHLRSFFVLFLIFLLQNKVNSTSFDTFRRFVEHNEAIFQSSLTNRTHHGGDLTIRLPSSDLCLSSSNAAIESSFCPSVFPSKRLKTLFLPIGISHFAAAPISCFPTSARLR